MSAIRANYAPSAKTLVRYVTKGCFVMVSSLLATSHSSSAADVSVALANGKASSRLVSASRNVAQVHEHRRVIDMVELNLVVNAIYRIEGGDKTKHPYGVLNRGILTTSAARALCAQTVSNHYTLRYKGASTKLCSRDFIFSLADRYCPPQCDRIGNLRWKRNALAILKIK